MAVAFLQTVPAALARRPLTEADAVDIWIARWLRIRRKDLVNRYGCDPRRLYEIWGEERLQRSVRVLPDGTFAFPLVGQVVAQGQLPADIERIITAALQPQYRGTVPQVTVMVKNPSGYQFSVVGKVRAPGTFTPGRYVNVLEAVSMAGGPTEFAQLGNVTIIRNVGRQMQSIPVRLNRVLGGGNSPVTPGDIPPIVGGDTIVVP